MAKPKKKQGRGKAIKLDQSPPQERVDAELVEEDHETLPNDEVLGSGDFFDHEQSDEIRREAQKQGAPGEPVVMGSPSSQMNPNVSEEEQGMDMRPAVVGPPGYGSPDAITSAGRLVPLSTHPLRPDALPEDHPNAISADYGQGYDHTLQGQQTVTGLASVPQSAVGNQAEIDATPAAREFAAEKGVDLSQVQGSGKDGSVTKPDVEAYLESLTPANSKDNS